MALNTTYSCDALSTQFWKILRNISDAGSRLLILSKTGNMETHSVNEQ